jgi:hypothetical protein
MSSAVSNEQVKKTHATAIIRARIRGDTQHRRRVVALLLACQACAATASFTTVSTLAAPDCPGSTFAPDPDTLAGFLAEPAYKDAASDHHLEHAFVTNSTLTRGERMDAAFAVLSAFADAADKNEVQYFMYGGTLIGAVRGCDLLPWDNDADVVVMPEDFEKLKETMAGPINGLSGIDDDRFVIECLGCESTKTTGASKRDAGIPGRVIDTHTGVYVDIFVPKINDPSKGFFNPAPFLGTHSFRRDDAFPLTQLKVRGKDFAAPHDALRFLRLVSPYACCDVPKKYDWLSQVPEEREKEKLKESQTKKEEDAVDQALARIASSNMNPMAAAANVKARLHDLENEAKEEVDAEMELDEKGYKDEIAKKIEEEKVLEAGAEKVREEELKEKERAKEEEEVGQVAKEESDSNDIEEGDERMLSNADADAEEYQNRRIHAMGARKKAPTDIGSYNYAAYSYPQTNSRSVLRGVAQRNRDGENERREVSPTLGHRAFGRGVHVPGRLPDNSSEALGELHAGTADGDKLNNVAVQRLGGGVEGVDQLILQGK